MFQTVRFVIKATCLQPYMSFHVNHIFTLFADKVTRFRETSQYLLFGILISVKARDGAFRTPITLTAYAPRPRSARSSLRWECSSSTPYRRKGWLPW